MPEIGLGIDDLELDLQNPRITTAADQREAMARIIGEQGVKLANLAADIIENGLNPMDRLLVIGAENGGGKYTVLEGNRRLVALKVLNNPSALADLAVRPVIRARLEALAATFDPQSVEPVACYEVASRAEGARWIEQRHTGENSGRGVVGWNATAASRFQSREQGRDPALQALDFVLEHGRLTEAQKAAVNGARLITTLRRILGTRDARAMIGFEVRKGRLITSLPVQEAIKPLRRIVLDLAEGRINVNNVYYKPDIIEYVSRISVGDAPDPACVTDNPRPLDEIGGTDSTPPPAASPPSGGGTSPAGGDSGDSGSGGGGTSTPPKRMPSANPRTDRPNLIPRSLRLSITNTKINEVYRELRSLSLTEHRYAISVLFRVFLRTLWITIWTVLALILQRLLMADVRFSKSLMKRWMMQ